MPDLATAEDHLQAFRVNGGFWYYATESTADGMVTTDQIPSFYDALVAFSNGLGRPCR